MVRIGACVVRVASVIKTAYIAVQANVARNAFRASSIAVRAFTRHGQIL